MKGKITDKSQVNSQMLYETIAKAGKLLMLAQPFYGLFLMMLKKQEDYKIKTLKVSLERLSYTLSINPVFWLNLSEEHQQGVLQHECLHIIHFHLTDFRHLTDKKLANIAMDLEINQYIPSKNLPEGGLVLSMFPELQLEEKKGTQYYYDKLLEGLFNNDPNVTTLIDSLSKGEGECQLPSGAKVNISVHDWKDFEDLGEGANKVLNAQTTKILQEVVDQIRKTRGTVPSEVEEILKRLEEVKKAKFDWKGYIRRFVGASTKVYTHRTRRRMNFRFAKDPGIVSKPHKHVLLAIDTSGSVSTTELKEFQNEMYHLTRNGTEVTVIQADSAVSKIESFNPKKDFHVYGRGGTNFQPVIDYYNENLKKYSCLIYMTDGEASNPKNVKGNVLWVLSSNSQMTNHLTGKTIKLEC